LCTAKAPARCANWCARLWGIAAGCPLENAMDNEGGEGVTIVHFTNE
jgi:hypothetical protein